MSSKAHEHLQIFDGGAEQANYAARHQSFALFPQLPEDLRLQIWRTSLQRERMIRICVHPIVQYADSDSPDGHTPRTPVYRTTGYRAAVRGPRSLSKLLRVSREARRAALAFFRVRIPCTFTRASPEKPLSRVSAAAPGLDGPLTFPFNPEYDVLHLSASAWPDHFITHDFLLDLPGLDPRGIGLRNLALDVNGTLLQLNGHMEGKVSPSPSGTSAESRAAALRTLVSSLREVLFITTTTLSRVLVPAWPRDRRGDRSRYEVLLLNRALPVLAHSPAFTRFTRDPRPLVEAVDLRRLFTSEPHGLRTEALAARARLARLGALEPDDLPADVCLRWLLAFQPHAGEVHSRETAEAFVAAEEAQRAGEGPGPSLADELRAWVDRLELENDEGGHDAGGRAHQLPVEDLRGTARTAFGYWSFPLNPIHLDAVEETEVGRWEFHHSWVINPLHDFSKSWPELLMMELD